MNRTGCAALIALSISAFAGASLAEDAASIAQARHEHFKQIGAAMKGLSDELKTPAPSLVQVRGYTQRLDELAPQLPSWFPAGSGPAAGIKTHAKAEVWQKPAEFTKDAAAFALEAHKINAAAVRGDLAAAAEAPALGQTCKTCHMAFRQKED